MINIQKLLETLDLTKSKIKIATWWKKEYSLRDFPDEKDFRLTKGIETHSDYKIIHLTGGLNGNGNWNDYLADIQKIFDLFSKNFKSVWLVKLDNDCPDDVFTLSIGVR